ncbi:MAG: 3-hydroxyacyl-CoA dehydrogenase NAD-binding domain-containing protein, partial [Pseudomonadota bacterium]
MFHYDKDASGIVTVTMDMAGQSANTMNADYRPLMWETVARLEREEGLTGVVFASAKKTWFAGGELKDLVREEGGEAFFAWVMEHHAVLRRLEKLPVPTVAAINGAALGGGCEIALACNARIAADDPKAVIGVPEVTLGLLPGAGGCVRLPLLLGLEAALPVLLKGRPIAPAKALKMGLVDQVVPADGLVDAAKAWIKANPEAHEQPWDRKGFVPKGGGVKDPKIRQVIAFAPTALIKETRGLQPASEAILDIAVSALRLPIDAALRVEARKFVKIVGTPEAKAMTTTFFFQMQSLRKGAARPEAPRWAPTKTAVLGAGMMGAGIAHAHATSGFDTVLTDRTLEGAEAGKQTVAGVLNDAVAKGRSTEAKRDAALARITPAADDLGAPDLIIEAVFEDLALKEEVIPRTFAALSEDGIYGSNTSTLPISLLAEGCPDPSRFIGIHFFSPVHRMKLVEIIKGEKTSPQTVAKAFDYVQAIRKIPIVVNDARGFFTSRVFGTFTDEGCALLRDGLPAAAVERAAWLAGMPVGPLAVFDEVSMVLSKKAWDSHKALDARLGVEDGFPADRSSAADVAWPMVEAGRGGRKYGGGFYDYPADGPKTLWPSLADMAEPGRETPSVEEARDRILYRMSLETLRCLEEGVLDTERDGNIGSIFAFGFPAATGGAIQF